ncbi:MAG: hypothetical protein EXS08_01825 [Planctomycetes bacterium]|nr:hypothetical protein [Planctomycetota bacterium]
MLAFPSPSARSPRPALALVALVALVALALFVVACGAEPEGPRWLPLARGFQPRPIEAQVAEWERAAGATTGNSSAPEPLGHGLTHALAAGDWRREEAGLYSLALPGGAFRASGLRPKLIAHGAEYARGVAGQGLALDECRVEGRRLVLRLAAATREPPPTLLRVQFNDKPAPVEVALLPAQWKTGDSMGTYWIELPAKAVLEGENAPRLLTEPVRVDLARALEPFEYRFEGERLLLRLPGEAPGEAKLALRLEPGRAVNGNWQLRLGRFCGDGLPVWSGAREELVRDVPAESRLSFHFAFQSWSDAPVTFRVRLDGEPLSERTLTAGEARASVSVACDLPASARKSARFAFEIDGPPGLGAFFAPVLGPRERGTSNARPWPAPPDVVLFLADTFRADNLALYGGDAALAPQLNRFAQQSLACAQARSNANWTLPSIGSLVSGLYPGQHAATDEDTSLPAPLTTLAERLNAAGYRTGAITDGSFFAPIFGLDQGFEWFAQHDPDGWDLERTLAEARAFLEADDGRPVFLVVHTYRTHQPYRTGAEEDRADYDALMARARVDAGTSSPNPTQGVKTLAHYQDELRALYQAGVRHLDAGFGAFATWLEERRYFEHGALVFTSDHGEALGENHEFFHSGDLWEVKLRVPLLVRAPGLTARVLPFTATLLDVAPTLAALAAVKPDPDWSGTSLLSLASERPAFAYQLKAKGRQVALLEGGHKLLTKQEPARLASGAFDTAYDLTLDPLEEHDLAQETDWPAELARRLAPAVLGQLAARVAAEKAGVPEELRQQLDDMGYGGKK